ncbi:MAG: hypothetical protein ACYTG0_12525 [Planctomycetota bacterium]|jgi:hypothetical protein
MSALVPDDRRDWGWPGKVVDNRPTNDELIDTPIGRCQVVDDTGASIALACENGRRAWLRMSYTCDGLYFAYEEHREPPPASVLERDGYRCDIVKDGEEGERTWKVERGYIGFIHRSCRTKRVTWSGKRDAAICEQIRVLTEQVRVLTLQRDGALDDLTFLADGMRELLAACGVRKPKP